ncbi:MAG: hypothetical protein Q4P72_03160 [Eubacteriales bacterium]|nr:hypothetical protein [Eubacteriales bacterium]
MSKRLYKAVALRLYPRFSYFEIAELATRLTVTGIPFVSFGSEHTPIRSEEGLLFQTEKCYQNYVSSEFRSFILPHCSDLLTALR